jgi:hypothetical protein
MLSEKNNAHRPTIAPADCRCRVLLQQELGITVSVPANSLLCASDCCVNKRRVIEFVKERREGRAAASAVAVTRNLNLLARTLLIPRSKLILRCIFGNLITRQVPGSPWRSHTRKGGSSRSVPVSQPLGLPCRLGSGFSSYCLNYESLHRPSHCFSRCSVRIAVIGSSIRAQPRAHLLHNRLHDETLPSAHQPLPLTLHALPAPIDQHNHAVPAPKRSHGAAEPSRTRSTSSRSLLPEVSRVQP